MWTIKKNSITDGTKLGIPIENCTKFGYPEVRELSFRSRKYPAPGSILFMVVRYMLKMIIIDESSKRKLQYEVSVVNADDVSQVIENPERRDCEKGILEGVQVGSFRSMKKKHSMKHRIHFLDVTSNHCCEFRIRVNISDATDQTFSFIVLSPPFSVLARQRVASDDYKIRKQKKERKRKCCSKDVKKRKISENEAYSDTFHDSMKDTEIPDLMKISTKVDQPSIQSTLNFEEIQPMVSDEELSIVEDRIRKKESYISDDTNSRIEPSFGKPNECLIENDQMGVIPFQNLKPLKFNPYEDLFGTPY